jgi:tight adherence protein C
MSDHLIIALATGFGFAVFAAAVAYSANRLKEEVPQEDREFLDPLPRALRHLWPLVRFVDYHLCQRLPQSIMKGSGEALRLSGLLYLMSPSQFIALCFVSLAGFTLTSIVLLSAVNLMNWGYVLLAAAFGYIYPRVWLKDSLARRRKQIVSTS